VHRIEALGRVGDLDRQQQEHRGEPVVDLVVTRGSHADRHQGSHGVGGRFLAAGQQEAAEGARDRGQVHVVDRHAVRPRDRLGAGQRRSRDRVAAGASQRPAQ
jgi:hypothetical protein